MNLPNNYLLRDYQQPIWGYFGTGGLRGVSVWHRRAGKDLTAAHRTCVEMHKRIGTYWHMLPQATQARKVIWDAIVYDADDKPIKLLDWVFPQEIRTRTNSQEMKIELICGSIYQLCGSDNYDSLIGSNPVGVIFSEYSVAKPSSWDYVRPILAENAGWAWFIYTPRGMNHGYELFEMAKENPEWFCEILTVRDTGAVSESAIQAEKNSGMSEDMIQQEFYCSFEAAIVGAYYGQLMIDAEKAGRITSVPYDPAVPVDTAWDIGVDDMTAIWFLQTLPGGEIHAIDYLEDAGQGIDYYLQELNKKAYVYGKDYVPHDFEARNFAAGGKSAADIAKAHGRKLEIIPRMNPLDRIQPTRAMLPRVYFDKDKTKPGRDCLKNYRREWNEERKTYLQSPVHDWASHGADAFGHYAVAYKAPVHIRQPGTTKGRIRQGAEAQGGWMRR